MSSLSLFHHTACLPCMHLYVDEAIGICKLHVIAIYLSSRHGTCFVSLIEYCQL